MAGTTGKRKATELLEDATKRQRVEDHSSAGSWDTISLVIYAKAQAEFGGQSDEEDEHYHDDIDFSDNGLAAETPATPFSPARKKFPSELKHLKCTWEGCTKTFNRPIRLQNHLKTHTNERTFACHYDKCDKAYFEDKHLQAHIKGSHTHERKHSCEWEGCGKSFLTATRLRRHIATHEGQDRFRCRDFPPCDQTFRKHQTLQRHIRSDHLQLAPHPCKYVDPLTKQPCNAGFDGASGLRKHEETVHGAPKFFCANCVIPNAFNLDGTPVHPGFSTSSQLQSHIRKEHTVTTCIFCDKECSNEKQLQAHVDSQHSGSTLAERKKIECTYDGCDKTFTRKSNLDSHIRIAHEGERFICGDFDTSDSLGLEEFEPEAGCGQDFSSKQYLEDHIRIAHLKQPSLVNGRRAKVSKSDDDFAAFVDDDEDSDDIYIPESKSKRKQRKDKHSALRAITGISGTTMFEDNDGIPYDLPSSWSATPGYEGEVASGDILNDVGWQLDQQAMQGGQFWIGGSNFNASNYDTWGQEENEMRRLVGGEH